MPRRDLFAQRTCANTALILACGLAAAQTPIDAERRALMATFETQEQACGTRFFVTDCQNAVAAQRRKALAELKRREHELETAQRQQRAQDALLQIEQKRSDALAREKQASDPDATPEARRLRQADKQASHVKQAQQALRNPADQKESPGPDAEQRQRNLQSYNTKKNDLQKRRDDREKRLKDHPNSGPPLPPEPL